MGLENQPFRKIAFPLLAIIWGVLLIINGCSPESVWRVASPDKRIKVEVREEGEQLYYIVKRDGDVLLQKSRLGIRFETKDFGQGLRIVSSEEQLVQQDYEMYTGKQKINQTSYNELLLKVANAAGDEIGIAIRAYNDGVAYRYELDEVNNQLITKEELSEFHLPPQSLGWMQRYLWWSPAYETEFENKIRVGTPSPQHREDGWSFPALFQVDSSWVLITESGLDRQYCGTHIRNTEDSPIYKVAYAIKEQGYKGGILYPEINTAWQSPWRVVMLGELETIVESNLVFHVADKPSGDFSWVQSGRASWSWLYEPTSSKDYLQLKNYVDFSSEMGWEYCLVDANWNLMKNGNIHQLIEYAQTQDIGLFLWYNSGGSHNAVREQPRDIMSDPVKRKAEFAKLKEWGIKGVKVDFFKSDKQDIIQLYIDIMEDAADYQIMVNFHGCTLPRGWQKTYPHLMTMEAVKGGEFFLLDKRFPYRAGIHNAILPYTRNVVGSMDYTPVNFSDNIVPHITTHAHELALSVVFESGILHFGDKISSYEAVPDYVKTFLSRVPAAWDETRFLQGYPGKTFVVARRKGDTWYVGGINGYWEETQLTIDLSFMETDTYKGRLIKRGKSARSFEAINIDYPQTQSLTLNVGAEDGFVIEFSK